MENNQTINLSVVVPVYNESQKVQQTVEMLKKELIGLGIEHEIIVINDGSTDDSKEVLNKIEGIKLINHPYNKGYGAALKTGVLNSGHDWILFFDSDGQHRPEDIKNFIAHINDYELIAGDRTGGKYVRPTLRKPGLWLLRVVANYLVDYKIPDLNCGLRLVKKNILKNYLHLMPNGFSMSTTSTLAFLKDKKNVKFLPIEINKREGGSKSTVKPRDGFTTLMLIFRLIMTFSPLRIFFPVSLILFIVALIFLAFDLISINLSDSTIFLFIASILVFFFGLLADQIAAIRREINNRQ
ncbi:MAG: glycosyltransferase family 2 protein [Patescibacteria group bacterium]